MTKGQLCFMTKLCLKFLSISITIPLLLQMLYLHCSFARSHINRALNCPLTGLELYCPSKWSVKTNTPMLLYAKAQPGLLFISSWIWLWKGVGCRSRFVAARTAAANSNLAPAAIVTGIRLESVTQGATLLNNTTGPFVKPRQRSVAFVRNITVNSFI